MLLFFINGLCIDKRIKTHKKTSNSPSKMLFIPSDQAENQENLMRILGLIQTVHIGPPNKNSKEMSVTNVPPLNFHITYFTTQSHQILFPCDFTPEFTFLNISELNMCFVPGSCC